jgi:lipid A 3-O-deacylase
MAICSINRRSNALGLLIAGLFMWALPALAQQARPLIDEVRLGVLAHDVPELWSGWTIENRKPDLNGEFILSPSLAFLGGKIRPAIGGTWNTGGGTSKAYIDARYEYQTALGMFFGLGLGAAVHNGYLDPVSLDHKALGSRVLFHIPIEVGYRFDNGQTLSVYFEHISNGYTQRSNEGLDSLGVRYGFRF